MEWFKKTTRIDFLGKRRYAYVVSAVLLLVSVGTLVARGLNFGIDFTGGTLVEVGYPQAVELDEVRAALHDNGFPGAVVQHPVGPPLLRLPGEGVEESAVVPVGAFGAHASSSSDPPASA